MMFVRIIRGALCASAACLALAIAADPALAQSASPSPAPSATPIGPIAIDSCSMTTQRSGYGFGNLTANVGKGYNFFKIGFTNQAKVTADQIGFQVDFGSSRITFVDKGSFAAGSSTTHTYRDHGTSVVASARPGGSGPTVCSVLSVHFTDGTTWSAPASAAPLASASP